MANSDGTNGYSLFNLDHQRYVPGTNDVQNQSGVFETNELVDIIIQNEPVKNFMDNMKLKLIGVPWRKNSHSRKGMN